MKRTGWRARWAVIAAASLAAAAVCGPVAAAGAAPAAGPRVRLIVAQKNITVGRYGRQVYLDPGIWVASLGSALELDAQRPDYSSPLSVTQVVHLPGGGTQRIPWPASIVAAVPTGLPDFVRMHVTNSSGKVVASSRLEFCPNDYNPERASPNSPATSPYPQECSGDPFPKSLIWGVAKGWAVDPADQDGQPLKLALGRYTVTETITPLYVQLLNIPAADATASVKVKVVKASGCCGEAAGVAHRPRNGPLRSAPAVPTLANPPASALPDLVPLPSWGISVTHIRKTTTHPASDQLDFGATVRVGNAPLDVEGFRSHGSPIMKAISTSGRTGISSAASCRYYGIRLEKGPQPLALRAIRPVPAAQFRSAASSPEPQGGLSASPRPTPVNLLEPNAVWQPSFLGFQCGSTTRHCGCRNDAGRLGDTYFQSVAGQSFNITGVPDGTTTSRCPPTR